MKRQLLTGIIALAAMHASAQVITDTVSTGATYANQVWYSLSADEQGSAAKNNWDLGFSASGFGSTIIINSITGTMLWNYPKSDASGWGSVDTNGLSTWAARWNSDTSWALGAMGRYADPTNSLDLDWGIYNMTTHIVTGDSLYIIKLSNGEYKKLMIDNLTSGTYNFKYANLDGTAAQTASISKSTYSTKNFGYYSLQTNAALDREPVTANWDLVFGQYTTFIPSAYTVTGVLCNKGVGVAKLSAIPDKLTYNSYSTATFVSPMNTIGYNWKTFTGMTYNIQDSLLFFVKPVSGDIWKVIMTGFGGSSTGNYIFTKEKLYTYIPAFVNGLEQATASVALYPNPSTVQTVNLLYSFPLVVHDVNLIVTDMAGKTVLTDKLSGETGLQQYLIPVRALSTGMYMVTVAAGSYTTQQKLIIQ